jgi:Ca-activated chloride channel homolog
MANKVRWVEPTWIVLVVCILSWGCGRTEKTAKSAVGPKSAVMNSGDFAGTPDVRRGNTEEYDQIDENPFVEALQVPQSTFAIDVDTASYANVRRFIRSGRLPEKGAVRLEELVNYFPYDYDEPTAEHPMSVSTELAKCPWNPAHQLLRVGLRGKPISIEERKPANLVFLLDVSGSMQQHNKLPLVKSSMRMLVEQLQPSDRIAIVVYAGASGLVLDSTPISSSESIYESLEGLAAGGSTNGGAGIDLAYAVAQRHFVPRGINRVILCTDGDFNVGTTSESALVDLITEKAKKNIFLTVLGFGTGNIKDSKMEQLADKGNGNYAYIDSLMEARKVLVDQIGGTLATIAKDVKIQVDFNPKHVSAYRLLGYENRLMANTDFRNDQKDAGEVGADHQVTAFYEVVPTGSSSDVETNRKSEFVESKTTGDSGTMLTVNLRYKLPDGVKANEFQVRLAASSYSDAPSSDFQFASSVLAYGMLLRKSEYAGNVSWDWVVSTAEKNRGKDPKGVRTEFVKLAKAASRLR